MSLYDVHLQRVTRGSEATRAWRGHGREPLGYAFSVWRHCVGTSVANFSADADRVVLWDEAGNRVAVQPCTAIPGAH